ncbi:hypothetical protein EBI_24945 [Enterocytozoon bieneusi H348]|nr:hypothetical protein EBI_24945 [Enterocytozoon bieneusi H348]|eukprot:XP_002650485.1 hypothetical protein EBI_24945 [Enterocytozoon bieneusi H348]
MNKFQTFVVEFPDSIEQRKAIFETISAVVQENDGKVVGQSQDDDDDDDDIQLLYQPSASQ